METHFYFWAPPHPPSRSQMEIHMDVHRTTGRHERKARKCIRILAVLVRVHEYETVDLTSLTLPGIIALKQKSNWNTFTSKRHSFPNRKMVGLAMQSAVKQQ